MKKLKITGIILIAILAIVAIQSCERESSEKGCGETNISKAGSDESHNKNQNCMSCHTSGGTGEGCFSVAGTAYKSNKTSYANAGSVKFYSAPNGEGTLKHTIAIDALGNFHTTESIDLTGLYPAITLGGSEHYMSTAPGNGSCNSCHGVSTDNLWGE